MNAIDMHNEIQGLQGGNTDANVAVDTPGWSHAVRESIAKPLNGKSFFKMRSSRNGGEDLGQGIKSQIIDGATGSFQMKLIAKNNVAQTN